jgi:mannitol 2-dehydrogenase
VLPIVRDGLKSGVPVEGLALVEAFWARMCEGTRDDGTAIEPNDPFWNELQTAARAARERPRAWLEQRYYGELGTDARFADAFTRWLEMIWSHGCETALDSYTNHQAN